MKVKALIKLLAQCDPEAEVVTMSAGGWAQTAQAIVAANQYEAWHSLPVMGKKPEGRAVMLVAPCPSSS